MTKKVSQNTPAKTWDLTINNYTTEMIENLKTWEDDVTRMVIAKEVGPKGTPHLQMKVTFKVAKRFTQLKKLVGTAHIEESMVDLDFLYCKKLDSDIVMNINNKKRGKRSDLDDAVEDLKNGSTITELCNKQRCKLMARDHMGGSVGVAGRSRGQGSSGNRYIRAEME